MLRYDEEGLALGTFHGVEEHGKLLTI